LLREAAEAGRSIQVLDYDGLRPVNHVVEMVSILEVDTLLLKSPAAPEIDHQRASDLERELLPVPKADEVNGEVDAGGYSRARYDTALLHEKDTLPDFDPRIAPLKLIGVRPMGGAGQAIEDSGFSQKKGSRAYRADGCTGQPSLPIPWEHGLVRPHEFRGCLIAATHYQNIILSGIYPAVMH
jgi:hypothetical protein